MRLFQLKNVIPNEQWIAFNVKGCNPNYCLTNTWGTLKKGLKLHGWCCKVTAIEIRNNHQFLYLEIRNKRVEKRERMYENGK